METESTSQVSPAALLEVCIYHMTRRATRAVTRAYDAALAPSGLTASQFTLLTTVAALSTDAGPVTVARLSERLLMEASTLSRNLQVLRDRGYLRWTEGSGRRAAHISLSDTGRKAFAAAIPAWQDMQRQLTQRLGSGKAGALLESLEAAATALSM